MTKVTEAIFTNGVLKPSEPLDLPDQQRVRLIVEPIDTPSESDRARAMSELRAGIAGMGFRSTGPYPSRDELHERR